MGSAASLMYHYNNAEKKFIILCSCYASEREKMLLCGLWAVDKARELDEEDQHDDDDDDDERKGFNSTQLRIFNIKWHCKFAIRIDQRL